MKGMVVHMEQDIMAWEASKPTDLCNLRFSLWYEPPSPELPNGIYTFSKKSFFLGVNYLTSLNILKSKTFWNTDCNALSIS